MLVTSIEDIAELVRVRRKQSGMTLPELAQAAGVGPRFVFDLEHGKETCRLGHVLKVMAQLGIPLHLGDPPTPAVVDDGSGLDLPEHGGKFAMDIEEDGGFKL